MKRKVSFLFALFALLLFGCSSSPTPDPEKSPPPSDLVSVETPSPQTDNPLLLGEFQVAGVQSGSGKDIGSRGYIRVDRSSLPDLSSPDFAEMLSEFMDQRIVGSDYNYSIVDFGDGFGLHFLGDTSTVFYCEIDGDLSGADYGYFTRDSIGDPFVFTDFHIRTIPKMTFQQEALIEQNYFEPVPYEVFNTPASENGLADTAFYAEGDVVSRSEVGGYDTLQLQTEAGDLYISAVSIPLPDISVGDHATVFFVYSGWSGKLDGASGVYVYSE